MEKSTVTGNRNSGAHPLFPPKVAKYIILELFLGSYASKFLQCWTLRSILIFTKDCLQTILGKTKMLLLLECNVNCGSFAVLYCTVLYCTYPPDARA